MNDIEAGDCAEDEATEDGGNVIFEPVVPVFAN